VLLLHRPNRTGVDGLFTADVADKLISVLQEVRLRAAA